MDTEQMDENSFCLDYKNQVILTASESAIRWLTGKVFYKSRLKHKVEEVQNQRILFLPDLTYIDMQSICDSLQKKLLSSGYTLQISDSLKGYIASKQMYIEKRAMLGLELKRDQSRVANEYEQFQDIVNEAFERKLRPKQMQDAFYMTVMKKSSNFSVPGSGKTSAALAVYAYLKHQGLVDKVIVICPKNAFGSWIDEFHSCFGSKEKLNCFNLHDPGLKTAKERKMSLKYESSGCNLFLINYESLKQIQPELESMVSEKTLLVYDEVHRVKSVEGQRAKAALSIAKNASYIITMTGTPIPNTYADLYNILNILYAQEYKDFFGFKPNQLKNPSQTEIEIINEKLQPFYCRTTKQNLMVPDPNQDIILPCEATETENRLLKILKDKYRSNTLTLMLRVLQLESNPIHLLEELDLNDFKSVLNITDDIDEIDFVDYSEEVKELMRSISLTSKMKTLLSCIRRLVIEEEKKVIVWCIFKNSITEIKKHLKDMGIKTKFIMGEVKLEDRLSLIEDFQNGKFDVLITNPHTLGESVSLHNVCHDAIYFEYSYNLVHLLQSKDRIHRLGLPADQYTQYWYTQTFYEDAGFSYSLDEKIYNRLLEKEQTMLNAIENNHFEPVYTPEEDLELIFQGLF